MAANQTIINRGMEALDGFFVGLTSKLVVAVIIILIGFIFGKVLGKLIQKVLKDLKLDQIVKKGVGVNLPIEHTISVFVTYFIYFIAIIMALNQLGLTTDVPDFSRVRPIRLPKPYSEMASKRRRCDMRSHRSDLGGRISWVRR